MKGSDHTNAFLSIRFRFNETEAKYFRPHWRFRFVLICPLIRFRMKTNTF